MDPCVGVGIGAAVVVRSVVDDGTGGPGMTMMHFPDWQLPIPQKASPVPLGWLASG